VQILADNNTDDSLSNTERQREGEILLLLGSGNKSKISFFFVVVGAWGRGVILVLILKRVVT
jgi:hypothetical protein